MQECKRSAVSYISPEHILLAMLNQSEATGKRVLERCAAANCSSCATVLLRIRQDRKHVRNMLAIVSCCVTSNKAPAKAW